MRNCPKASNTHLPHGPFFSVCCCTVWLPVLVLLTGTVVDPSSTSIILSAAACSPSLLAFCSKLYHYAADARCQHALPLGLLAGFWNDHFDANKCPLSIALSHNNGPMLFLMTWGQESWWETRCGGRGTHCYTVGMHLLLKWLIPDYLWRQRSHPVTQQKGGSLWDRTRPVVSLIHRCTGSMHWSQLPEGEKEEWKRKESEPGFRLDPHPHVAIQGCAVHQGAYGYQ